LAVITYDILPVRSILIIITGLLVIKNTPLIEIQIGQKTRYQKIIPLKCLPYKVNRPMGLDTGPRTTGGALYSEAGRDKLPGPTIPVPISRRLIDFLEGLTA
jgi:hypothetical protein